MRMCMCACAVRMPAHMRMPMHNMSAQVEENRELFQSPLLLGGPTRRALGLARKMDLDGGVSTSVPLYIEMKEGTEAQEKKVRVPHPPPLEPAPPSPPTPPLLFTPPPPAR